MSKGFTCECGRYYAYTAYVSAHSNVTLTHTCGVRYCGRKHKIFGFEAKLVRGGTRRKKK